MADKNIQMTQRNASNTGWDNLYPITKAENVLTQDGSNLAAYLYNNFQIYKSGKDSNGIFTIVEYKRADGTLYARSVLSGGTSPQYTTRTITYYAANGTTVLRTDTYTLTYDTDGDLISEVKQ
ncbi:MULTISPECIES: hypothetical protein [Geobacillus]|uniref:Uncharacterized protein n=1 Tax=Geobacillus kaustophilus (strain HTA426) TaxID=235909 RepID=Q5L2K0_GEOKA|nr:MULTISPECIES: hypothetical protein [Geobacillus]MBW7642409.1 hypothetical protein [Geobacillus thermoleovorans]MCK7604867.1 hypothetical protein [Geobacillus stearothermophilus]BAD74830.1 hypothetical protein GK0545 [Geobacillus kaustophilus HTA426]